MNYQRYYFKDGQYVGMRPYVGDFQDEIDKANKMAADAAAKQAAEDQAAGRVNPGGVFNYPAASPPYALIALAGLAAVALALQLSGAHPFRFLGIR